MKIVKVLSVDLRYCRGRHRRRYATDSTCPVEVLSVALAKPTLEQPGGEHDDLVLAARKIVSSTPSRQTAAVAAVASSPVATAPSRRRRSAIQVSRHNARHRTTISEVHSTFTPRSSVHMNDSVPITTVILPSFPAATTSVIVLLRPRTAAHVIFQVPIAATPSITLLNSTPADGSAERPIVID